MKKTSIYTAATAICLSLVTLTFSDKQADNISSDTQSQIVSTASTPEVGKGSIRMNSSFDNPYLLNDGADSEFVHLLVSAEGLEMKQLDKRSSINMSVVIDRSGSMEGEKLDNAKIACQTIIEQLEAEDKISLVVYSDNASVLSTASQSADLNTLKRKVWTINSGGSTNLSEGMNSGYEEVKKTFQSDHINRVLLLSDGLANRGITGVKQLSNIAKAHFDQDNISMSTFGVGADYNEDLMTDIAELGMGNYHFINSSDDMASMFEKELEGMLSVVAQNAYLNVQFPSEYFTVDKVFGHQAEVRGNIVSVNYNDITSTQEKTVLIRFRKRKTADRNQNFSVNLSYEDVQNDFVRYEAIQDLTLTVTGDASLYSDHHNEEVKQQMLLFSSVEKFEEAAKVADDGDYEKARQIIRQNIQGLSVHKDLIENSPELKANMDMNAYYESELEDVEEKTVQEVKIMQKANKSSNYMMKKKVK